MARAGPQGDFMVMAKQSSMINVLGKQARKQLQGGTNKTSNKERRTMAEGKQCAFCGLRFIAKDVQAFTEIGGSPHRRKRPQLDAATGRATPAPRGSGTARTSATEGSAAESPGMFARTVPNFGYTFTERMMLDVVTHMVHRGVKLDLAVGDELRTAFGNQQSGAKNVRTQASGGGVTHRVCRLCFEVQNSQRSVEALGRQYAHALGVPACPRVRTAKVAEALVGPGRGHVSLDLATGGPPVYLPNSGLYRANSNGRTWREGTPDGDQKGSEGPEGTTRAAAVRGSIPPLPTGSLKPRTLRWIDVHKVPTTAYKYRLTLMFHEIQDFPDVALDKLDMEIQYRMVEHVHRLAISAPVRIGDIVTGTAKASGSSSRGSRASNSGRSNRSGSMSGSSSSSPSPPSPSAAEATRPFILCPIKHVRMHYLAASEEGLQHHLTNTKLKARILVRARRGDAAATAQGDATISMAAIANHGSDVGHSMKHTVVVPCDVPPLGTLLVRVSLGLSCIASMDDEESFADPMLRVARTINARGGVFWFPEDHFDLKPLPDAWMGSFNLDLEARARALRDGNAQPRGKAAAHKLEQMNKREAERVRLVQHISDLRTQLLDELDKPELRTERQAEEVRNAEQQVSDVGKMIDQQCRSVGLRTKRLLVLAHSQMLYERLMERAAREEHRVANLEHHQQDDKENTPALSEHEKILLARNASATGGEAEGGADVVAAAAAGEADSASSSGAVSPGGMSPNNTKFPPKGFRELLHELFQRLLRTTEHGIVRKRTRRFRRSGSLDGNFRGEKRLILSEEERVPSVSLERLMAIVRARAGATAAEARVQRELQEAAAKKKKARRHKRGQQHSPAAAEVVRLTNKHRRAGGKEADQHVPEGNLASAAAAATAGAAEPVAKEEDAVHQEAAGETLETDVGLRQKWLELVSLLEGMRLCGMHSVRWQDLMSVWNGQGRRRRVALAKHLSEDDVEEQDEGVDSKGGGDNLPEAQTIERRWIRHSAAKLVFQSVLRSGGGGVSHNHEERSALRLLQLPVLEDADSAEAIGKLSGGGGVVDVSELRSFMRGVISSKRLMGSQNKIAALERRMTAWDKTRAEAKQNDAEDSKTAETQKTAGGGDGDDKCSTSAQGEAVDARDRELIPTGIDVDLDAETALKLYDLLYYHARAEQRAAIELCVAIEESEVWHEMCTLYDRQQRDSTLSWADFSWLASHAYGLRVATFRRSAYVERAIEGNTEAQISHVVGSCALVTCLRHGPWAHFSSDGRCTKCEDEAAEFEPLRLAMAARMRAEAEAAAVAATKEQERRAVAELAATKQAAGRLREEAINGNAASAAAQSTAPKRKKKKRSTRLSQSRRAGKDIAASLGPVTEGENPEQALKKQWTALRKDRRGSTPSSSKSRRRPKSAKPRLSSMAALGRDRDRKRNSDASAMIEVAKHDAREKWANGGADRVAHAVGSGEENSDNEYADGVDLEDYYHEDDEPTLDTRQRAFRRPKRVASKSARSRPESAPLRRRQGGHVGRPASASNRHSLRPRSSRLRSGASPPLKQSLEARNRAREIAQTRIAALEGTGGAHMTASSKRQARLREQLGKSNTASQQRARELEHQLQLVRTAMEKEIRASLRNNRRAERAARAARDIRASSSAAALSQPGAAAAPSSKRKTRKNTDSGAGGLQRSQSASTPLHEQAYVGGILRDEQEKVMAKVRRLVMREVASPQGSNGSEQDVEDAAVLAPVLRSALIKYARQGDLDAVRDLLDAGVDPDTRLVESPRRTILMESARTGRTALAELLVSHGASIAAKDDDGLNALYHAYNAGHGPLAERLVATQSRFLRK